VGDDKTLPSNPIFEHGVPSPPTPEVNEPSNENIFPKFVCEMGAKLVA